MAGTVLQSCRTGVHTSKSQQSVRRQNSRAVVQRSRHNRHDGPCSDQVQEPAGPVSSTMLLSAFSMAGLAASLGAFAADSASAAEVWAVAASESGVAVAPLTSTSAMAVAALAGAGALAATTLLSSQASKLPPQPKVDRSIPKSRFGLGEAKPPPPPKEMGVKINAPVTVGTSFAKSSSPIISSPPIPLALAVQPHFAHGASRPLPAATSFSKPQPKPTPLGTSFDPPSDVPRPSWSSASPPPPKAWKPRVYPLAEAMAAPKPLALSFARIEEDELAQGGQPPAALEGADNGAEMAAEAGVEVAVAVQ